MALRGREPQGDGRRAGAADADGRRRGPGGRCALQPGDHDLVPGQSRGFRVEVGETARPPNGFLRLLQNMSFGRRVAEI